MQKFVLVFCGNGGVKEPSIEKMVDAVMKKPEIDRFWPLPLYFIRHNP